MILIITSKRDGHINAVVDHLDAAGVPWIRLNTEDFATNITLAVSPADRAGVLRVRDSRKLVDLREVRAVWFRKPEPVNVGHFGVNRSALDYVEAELNEILFGLYSLLSHAVWINDPFTTRRAHRKLWQLKVAKDVGFVTPRTIVTNDPEVAMRFARSIGRDVALKSLGSISVVQRQVNENTAKQYGIFTRRVSLEELQRVADKFRHMPTLLQEFIEKEFELRITCVGRTVFTCRIESRPGQFPADDYRFDVKNVNHSAYDCQELHAHLFAYMDALDLSFGCFDVLISKSGCPVFLECNPNGQFLWVEKMIGLQISKAIADLLKGAMHQQPSVRKRRRGD